jgi:hypothetical protein
LFWVGESDKKAQARWDSIIQLMSKGGKILDPQLQANALLAKILIKGPFTRPYGKPLLDIEFLAHANPMEDLGELVVIGS